MHQLFHPESPDRGRAAGRAAWSASSRGSSRCRTTRRHRCAAPLSGEKRASPGARSIRCTRSRPSSRALGCTDQRRADVHRGRRARRLPARAGLRHAGPARCAPRCR
ncbi:MAG: hypothetical protein MZV70_33680 [Desulfobacterales bacterium]|nr:hypothetical protein [Desulfobacterales bacterium]